MNLTLRAGRPDDSRICGQICYEAFRAIAEQHAFPPDFPSPEVAQGLLSFLLAREDIYAVVAEIDGRAVGSNFLWETAAAAGVGPITVDPTIQNAAVGRSLMTAVMDRARQQRFASVRLVQAAYHNRSLALYTKLGFEAREPLSMLQGAAIRRAFPGHPARLATEHDREACDALCRRVHGHDRSQELLDAIRQGTATVVERDSRITGYATMVGFFGHAVGEGNEDLKALIAAAEVFPGPGFLLPTRNGEVLRWCLAAGLRLVQPMTLMSVGLYCEPKGAFLSSILY